MGLVPCFKMLVIKEDCVYHIGLAMHVNCSFSPPESLTAVLGPKNPVSRFALANLLDKQLADPVTSHVKVKLHTLWACHKLAGKTCSVAMFGKRRLSVQIITLGEIVLCNRQILVIQT